MHKSLCVWFCNRHLCPGCGPIHLLHLPLGVAGALPQLCCAAVRQGLLSQHLLLTLWPAGPQASSSCTAVQLVPSWRELLWTRCRTPHRFCGPALAHPATPTKRQDSQDVFHSCPWSFLSWHGHQSQHAPWRSAWTCLLTQELDTSVCIYFSHFDAASFWNTLHAKSSGLRVRQIWG